MIIKFTDEEVSALLHRLSIPECIAMALTDFPSDGTPCVPFHADYVEDRANALATELVQFRQLVIITKLDREILREAIDGCTLPSVIESLYAEGEYSKKEANRRMLVLKNLEAKVREHGINLSGFSFTEIGG